MKIEIKNLDCGVIFTHECDENTVKKTLETAVYDDEDLSGANLRGADLRGADLRGANLSDADLSGAYLRGADLSGAYLSGAYLSGAYLRGAYLRGANLSGAYLRGAYLSGAYMARAILENATLPKLNIPIIPDIHNKIYQAVSDEGTLNMGSWHTCETTHCRAGWAVYLSGNEGKKLEDKIGTNAAGALIYMASDPTLESVPDWFASNEDAMEDIKKLAGVIE